MQQTFSRKPLPVIAAANLDRMLSLSKVLNCWPYLNKYLQDMRQTEAGEPDRLGSALFNVEQMPEKLLIILYKLQMWMPFLCCMNKV